MMDDMGPLDLRFGVCTQRDVDRSVTPDLIDGSSGSNDGNTLDRCYLLCRGDGGEHTPATEFYLLNSSEVDIG